MRRLLLILPLVLAACGSSEGPIRYAVPLLPPEGRVAVSTASLEVREVGLPLYAELEEIYVLGEDGALRSDTEILWADAPRRAMTQGLALALADLTGARVAAEPWPLEAFPEARLDVRFDQVMAQVVAQESGVFVLSGQYFLSNLETGGDKSGRFGFSVPFVPTGPNAVAVAKGRGLNMLARQIAAEAL